jgi:uncharacterized protein (TIGR02145 family)
MAENLNYAVEGRKCYYDDPANCATYGRLYDWATARTVCPSGWHLPSSNEWKALKETVGAARYDEFLKAESWDGIDLYGFSALPGGYGSYGYDYDDPNLDEANYYFRDVGKAGYWWLSDKVGTSDKYYESIGQMDAYSFFRSNLLSVRCVKDYY